MFEFLFKYSLDTYRSADWFFQSGWSLTLLALVCVIVILAMAGLLFRANLTAGRKGMLWALQAVFAGTLLTMLWRPALQLEDVVAGENSVIVMLDNSQSMLTPMNAQNNRLESATNALNSNQTVDQLSKKYSLELQGFAAASEVVDTFSLLPEPGPRTALLDSVRKNMENAQQKSLSAIVVVSDGSDNDPVNSADWWQELAAFQVPVHTVAIGRSRLPGDIELGEVLLPDNIGTSGNIPVSVGIVHDGPNTVQLKIYDGNELLRIEELTLPDSHGRFMHSTAIEAAGSGVMDLRFELAPLEGETTVANNRQRRVVQVREQKQRILYIEGEPRWEYKFLRRALAKYDGVELVSLLRTSPNKFYRQGVRNAEELQDGFPVDQSELYAYDAIIIGSLEAAHLSGEQQRFLRDFVRVRGGSLLMLGGRNGLGQGGWSRSEVAQALPAVLDNREGAFERQRRRAMPTALGEKTDWLMLDPVSDQNLVAWSGLPEIADFHAIGKPKAGASVLLVSSVDGSGDLSPLLLWQRYGRGKSYIMATSGTWRWQMGLPAKDLRHEQFWQGFVGHLVSGVLPRMTVSTDKVSYLDDTRVALNVSLRNTLFEVDSQSELTALLQKPDGTTETIELVSSPQLPGHYAASIEALSEGDYKITVSHPDDPLLSESVWFIREDSRAETFSLRRNDELLKRLAETTGGVFLEMDEIEQLPGLLSSSESLLTRMQILPVWNIPFVFFLLIASKLLEWVFRWRWRQI